jgi:hypothetical protein
MERVYLQWNVVNWITVLIMVTGGWAVIGLISSAIKARQGG